MNTEKQLQTGNSDSLIVCQLDPSGDNLRNSEGSFVTLKSGRIVFAYSRFRGGHGDFEKCDIAAIHSDNAGLTWSEPDILIQNSGAVNCMSVSLLRLQDGRIALMYIVKNGLHDCRPRIIFSDDDMKTWSKPVEPISAPGYFVVNNDRLVQTSTGRLIVPAAFHRMKSFDGLDFTKWEPRGIAFWFLSDDGGVTWNESATWWALPVHSDSGIQEPGVAELSGGRLLTWYRTSTGYQWRSCSRNDGESWSVPEQTEFASPTSPMSMKHIPGTDKLLAVWNDVSGRYGLPPAAEESWGRTPLVCAAGDAATAKSWTNHKVIENDPERGFCYTAIHFVDDAVLLAYCAGGKPTASVLDTLRIRRINKSWIME